MTWRELRELLVSKLGDNAILVGHGLHNDLRAIQLDYWPVIDTANVFAFHGLPRALNSPSLSVLAQAILGKVLHEPGQPHSPREDAITTLEVALCAASSACALELKASVTKVAAADTRRLLVHRIPDGVTLSQLQGAFGEGMVVGHAAGARKVLLHFSLHLTPHTPCGTRLTRL
jgi:hypothetical protein